MYAAASVFCRFLEGFGNGCLNSGCKYSPALLNILASNLMMNEFPAKKLAKLNGVLQTFTGLGMMLGPLMGSVLFKIGGFQLPFYTVGGLLLFLALVINCLVKENKQGLPDK